MQSGLRSAKRMMPNPLSQAALAAHNAAMRLAQARQFDAAKERLLEAISLVGTSSVDVRTLKALWEVAIAGGDWRTGLAAGMLAAQRDPSDRGFGRHVFQSLERCPAEHLCPDLVAPTVPLPADLPGLSVVLVSRDDARFRAVDAQYAQAFANWPHERIRIADARSMYDGYARGFAASRGEWVIFSHDDIQFAAPDFAARLARNIPEADIVGVVGTTLVSGPGHFWSGHPYMFGAMTHEGARAKAYNFGLLSLSGPRVVRAQGLDGVFVAARRDWIERVGFDPATFAGFHLYDLDFTYRAHLAGARLVVGCDLAMIHQSSGAFDERWHEAARAFTRKFHFSGDLPGRDRNWYGAMLPNVDAVATMYAKLFAAWDLRLG